MVSELDTVQYGPTITDVCSRKEVLQGLLDHTILPMKHFPGISEPQREQRVRGFVYFTT